MRKYIKVLRFLFINLKLYLRARLGLVRRLFFTPKIPVSNTGKVLLHLGCGEINSPGFINVDTRPLPHVHHIKDITNLSVFEDNFADLIYACMVLEHLPGAKLQEALLEWKRVLKKGGILRLTVPDFDKIIGCYQANNNNIECIAPALIGGQGYKYNFHFSIFNKEYLGKLLSEIGLSEIREWRPDQAEYHDFSDWADQKLVIDDRKFFISLNLEATK